MNAITIEQTINAPVEVAWYIWTTPEHIMHWNNASPDWRTPAAENDLRPGGKFSYRMEAKDGSMGFDFWGIYDAVEEYKLIEYTLGDGRKVSVVFTADDEKTIVVETFEPESVNPVEMQKMGWQMILDNFKKHTEAS